MGSRPGYVELKKSAALRVLERERREMFGAEIIAASDGVLATGTVYVYLGALEDEGSVASRLEAPHGRGLRRRLYRITDSGRRAAARADLESESDRQADSSVPGGASLARAVVAGR